jgi:hypothetical protein
VQINNSGRLAKLVRPAGWTEDHPTDPSVWGYRLQDIERVPAPYWEAVLVVGRLGPCDMPIGAWRFMPLYAYPPASGSPFAGRTSITLSPTSWSAAPSAVPPRG